MEDKKVIEKYLKEYENHRVGGEIMTYVNKKYGYLDFQYGGKIKVKMPFGEKIYFTILPNKNLKETGEYFGTVDLDNMTILMYTQN